MYDVDNKAVDAFYIAGTDTEVGKTHVALTLIESLVAQGHRVAALKPVASGAEMTADGLRNADALALQAACNVDCPYEVVNPYCYAPPIAPHIAAAQQGETIQLERIAAAFAWCVAAGATHVVVESAGGWLTPINATETMADIAVALQLPVILVVGMRLGCLNHALLTATHIDAVAPEYMGWVANHLTRDMLVRDENMQTLVDRLGEPMLSLAFAGE